MDLSFTFDNRKFNYRVCAIIISNGKILAMKDEHISHYYLPGGRVQFGETAEQALIREIKEELGVAINIIRPLWLAQAFFNVNEKDYHEMCLYFLVNIASADLLGRGEKFTIEENKTTHTFEWMKFDKMKDECIYPLFIKTEVFNLPESLKLITEKN